MEGREPVKEHLVITRYSPKRVEDGEMLSFGDVQEILRMPVLGVIPESEIVLQASNQGTPAIHMEGSDVAQAYGRGGPLPRRRAPAAFRRLRKARPAQAPVRREVRCRCFH
jgi:septum formation inhibitor-activating ATPase MinD